jgi:Zn-dependent protease
MLNEQASSSLDQPVWHRSDYETQAPDPYHDLREAVGKVLTISREVPADADLNDGAELVMLAQQQELLITFEGKLLKNSEQAYDELDTTLNPDDRFALFRKSQDANAPHRIHILQGRVVPVKGRPWVNLVLFVLTLLSVFFVGSFQGIDYAMQQNPELTESDMFYQVPAEDGTLITAAPRLSQIWRGYPYALSLLLILGAHELGHYFAARRHNHSVSLPYFIPMPISALGTMGAVIRSREPMRNRKVLMDIGAAGPLAGMVFAIPVLLIGLATSPVMYRLEPGTHGLEGNSLLYAAAKVIVKGAFYPTATHDVFINQMAFAGWLGLLVTALNLIPVGQLDGGHVLYALFGQNARRAYYPVLAVLVVLAALSQVWVIWVILLFLLGRLYAPPLDDITPLDNRRRGVAIFTLALFVLVFVPRPFTVYTVDDDDVPDPSNQQQVEHAPGDDTRLMWTIE